MGVPLVGMGARADLVYSEPQTGHVSQRPRVVFIAGEGRSGSTLLDRILGSCPGFFSCGELIFIWDRGLANDQLCGCGEVFSSCPLWTTVLRNCEFTVSETSLDRLRSARDRYVRIRNIPLLAVAFFRKHLEPLATATESLHSAIAQVSGCRWIIDSSKWPAYGFFLKLVTKTNIRVVHLVRDPRGVAFSWARPKVRPEILSRVEYMHRYNYVRSAVWWIINNILSRILGIGVPYIRIRYEDLTRDPHGTIEKLLQFLEEPVSPPLSNRHWLHPGKHHTVSGNPSRFQSGAIDIRTDEEWIMKMPRLWKVVVTLLTLPILLAFGYHLWPKQGEEARGLHEAGGSLYDR